MPHTGDDRSRFYTRHKLRHGLKERLRRTALTTMQRAFARHYASPRIESFLDYILPVLLVRRLASEMDADIIQRVLPERRQAKLGECPPAGILYRTIWDLAGYGCLKHPIMKRVDFSHAGGSFSLELDMSKTPECGYYFYDSNPRLTHALEQARSGGTMLDIGANVGFYSLVASLFFDNVVAFEPCAPTFQRLERNILLSVKRNVRAYRLGLSSHSGIADMYVAPNNPGSNSIAKPTPTAAVTPETIEVRTLDSLARDLKLENVDFIKIDVEGHEPEVLRGAHDTLDRWRPQLFVECHDDASVFACAAALPSGYVPWDPQMNRAVRVEDIAGSKGRDVDVVFRDLDKAMSR